ncbi:hypothetical protein, partial [Leptospira interrogans]
KKIFTAQLGCAISELLTNCQMQPYCILLKISKELSCKFFEVLRQALSNFQLFVFGFHFSHQKMHENNTKMNNEFL